MEVGANVRPSTNVPETLSNSDAVFMVSKCISLVPFVSLSLISLHLSALPRHFNGQKCVGHSLAG